MESSKQQASVGNENLKLKILLKDEEGNNVDARITNMGETAVQFSAIKAAVVLHFPELGGKEFDIGWIDEEKDWVVMSSDEELEIALAALEGAMMKIHVKMKKNVKSTEKKSQLKKTIQIPHQYFSDLLVAQHNLSVQGSVVLHDQNLEGIRRVISKHPGLLFIGGDWKEEMSKIVEKRNNGGEKKKQGLKIRTKMNRMTMSCHTKDNDSAELKVNRIIPTPNAMALLNAFQKKTNDEDVEKLSFLFVPLIAGRKRQHCHVLGTWKEDMEICVAFKRRGKLEQGNTGGIKKTVDHQNVRNKAGTGANMRQKPCIRSPANVRFVGRKRMKKVASSMFAMIDLTKVAEKIVG